MELGLVRENNKNARTARFFIGRPSSKGLVSTMRMIHCKEMFAEFYIDPAAATKIIPQNYKARVYDDGHAMLLLMVQDCEKCILNRLLRIAPMRMSHIWIEILGPENIGPQLPGTERSLPTRYYYALPHQIDNALAFFALWFVGIDVQKVKRIALGDNPGGIRHGKVIAKGNPAINYRWEEKSAVWPSADVVTGRRWFYREYGRIIRRRSEGLVVCNSSFLGNGDIRLDADMGSPIESLGLGTTLIGKTNPVEIDNCHVSIRVLLR